MLEKQKGIIIRSVDYGESDKIITALNEHGAKVSIMVRRIRKSKTGLQAHTQLFVYGLFIYNKWKGMGTFNSTDAINQYYRLRLDILDSSYTTLCIEAIDRSLEPDEVSLYHYKLLEFVLNKISEGNSAQLMPIIVLLECMNKLGFGAFFNYCAITGDADQSKLIVYSSKYDGTISETVLDNDPYALKLFNKIFYLLDTLQKLPIDKMNHFNTNQTLLDEMSELMAMLYKEYAGMYFKGQKLINQLKRLE